MSANHIREESFSSDTDFDDEQGSDASSTDLDAKLEQEDVFDIDFFKCYSALKKKDEKIYDKSIKFFNENSSSESEQEAEDKEKLLQPSYMKKTEPKMTLLDHQLNVGNDELEDKAIVPQQNISQSFYEKELSEIKDSIAKISEDVDSDSDDEFLISSSKNKLSSIMDKVEGDEGVSHLKQIWGNSDQLTEEERFLRDYILNKRYIKVEVDDEDEKAGYFSKNLDELSDVASEDESKSKKKARKVDLHSQEAEFDKIVRIPRNSTKTIRDLVEKQEKKEKRLSKLKKEKKRKKVLKDADCEDIVGDLPTRFHYRETEPNDYGLTAQELLLATDEELDKWISLRDTVKHRSTEEELALKHKYESKRHDIELKKKFFKSIYGDDDDDDDGVKPKSKSKETERVNVKGKLTKKRSRVADEEEVDDNNAVSDDDKNIGSDLKKKKKRKRGTNHKKFAKAGIAPARLLAYGISKNKLRKASLL